MPEPLNTELRLMRLTDREIKAILVKADKDIQDRLRRLGKNPKIGAKTRSAQLRIRRDILRAFRRVGDYTEEGIARAVREATKVFTKIDSATLRKLGINPKSYMNELAAEAEESIKLLQAKKTNGIRLAERVYKDGLVAAGKIDEIVNVALARGSSAAEIMKSVHGFVNPDTPGGARYAAQRLARTEINNAFHETAIQRYASNEFVDYVDWNLSGSHPEPDRCNEFAEQVHVSGQEAGVYRAGDIPQRPHPNCLCYITPRELDEEEFDRRIANESE